MKNLNGLHIILVMYISGIVGWHILRLYPGDWLWPVALANYFAPWLMMIGLVILPSALFWGRPYLLWAAVITLLPLMFHFFPLFMPKTASAIGTPIRVMSYNLLYTNQDNSVTVALIHRHQPDILLLQELNPSLYQALVVDDFYPYHQFHPGDETHGLGIFSRYPVSPPIIQTARYEMYEIEIEDRPVTLINAHISGPRKYPAQRQQVEALAGLIERRVSGPLLIGGDFNTTDYNDNYKILTRHLSDAYRQAGWGFGFTFPANRPVVRIDHIFHNHHFVSHSAQILTEQTDSDHRPILIETVLVTYNK